jgi:hypothetical protein
MQEYGSSEVFLSSNDDELWRFFTQPLIFCSFLNGRIKEILRELIRPNEHNWVYRNTEATSGIMYNEFGQLIFSIKNKDVPRCTLQMHFLDTPIN